VSAASSAIVRSPRDAWLARRRALVTASDAAAILGVDPRRGPLAVYAAKLGVESDETEPMAWGRRLEDAIAEAYGAETGREVIAPADPYEITVHPELDWLGATLDRTTRGCQASPPPVGLVAGFGPLQLKAVSDWRRKDWLEEPPIHYQVQVQVEMACAGAAWGSLAAFQGITRPVAWADLVRNDGFLAAALPRLHKFWWRVQRREPPEADGLPGTTEAIRTLWARDDGQTIALDGEALALVGEWDDARALAGTQAGRVRELTNRLRTRMGSATFGALPDGSFLTLKLVQRGSYEVQETEYRTLRRWRPRIPGR